MRQPLPILGEVGEQRKQHETANKVQRIVERQRTQSTVTALRALQPAKPVDAGRTNILGLPI